ncbi:MAG: hypothetical protein DI535_09120 [Citrobacter freundii]|nr:MAG: hypothetical protein DI535_09120 [Citrobacter freundii]
MRNIAKPIVGLLAIVFIFLFANTVKAQLLIDSATKWISDTGTLVTLNSLGLRYNSVNDPLDNAFQFTGAEDVWVEGTTVPDFRTIIIDKSTGQLILNTDLQIHGKVKFKTGLFNLNDHIATLTGNATIESESESSRFTDTSNGSVKISVNVTAPAALNPGNIGAVISSATYTGNLTIFRGHHPQAINSPSYNSISRYYLVFLDDKPAIDATLRFYYADAEKNGLDENNFTIWVPKEDHWNNIGRSSANATLNYVEQTGLNTFGKFAIAPGNLVLPVTGLQLTGAWTDNLVLLNWKTITEINNDHFDIERKYQQDSSFSKIASVASHYPDGNSQVPSAYSFKDAGASAEALSILYRLKQVDKNGSSHYSNTLVIRPVNVRQFIVNVYPTVSAGDRIFIQTGGLTLNKMQVRIADLSGKLLFSQSLPYQSAWINLPVLSAGIYKLIIQSGANSYNTSFIK